MNPLTPLVKTEKNKLTSDSVWLNCLEIFLPSTTDIIRIVANNEDITWNGNVYQRFPFEVEEISESSTAETTQLQIKVSNVDNIVGSYVREYHRWTKTNIFVPISVNFYLLNSKDLENTNPAYKTKLTLAKPTIDHKEVIFTVSARDLFRSRTPQYRMFPNSCRWGFKSTQCGYNGAETKCDKTLKRCKELNNSPRFGGFPTIGRKGVSV